MLGEPLLSLSTTSKYKIKATITEEGEEKMSEIIDRFKKNAVEEIRASLTEFSGHKLVDLRIWAENKAGELVPTKKGISVRVDLFPALLRAVESVRGALIERGELDPVELESTDP